jgi:hypothetical protein
VLWGRQWLFQPSLGNITGEERDILHTLKAGTDWLLLAICQQVNKSAGEPCGWPALGGRII